MTTKRIGFLIAAVLIFLTFYFILPVTFVHSAQMFWGFVGGILTGGCIFLAGKQSEEKRYDIDNYQAGGRKESLFIIIGVIVAFVGSFILYMSFGTKEEKFIKANPALAQGTIVDGVSSKSRKSSSYELTVKYKDSNAVEYQENIDVSASEWNNAGKGMPVTVAYEKDNPDICKLLLNTKDVMMYIDKNKKIHPSLKNIFAILNTKDYKEQKALLGDFWSVNQFEALENGTQFSNYITKDNLVLADIGNYYINESEQDETFKEILAEAKTTMKVVFDSMKTNTTKGILLENDSVQIRFQEYSSVVKSDSNGEINIVGYSIKKIRCFGFAKKDKFMILPGDLKQNENDPIIKAYNRNSLR